MNLITALKTDLIAFAIGGVSIILRKNSRVEKN